MHFTQEEGIDSSYLWTLYIKRISTSIFTWIKTHLMTEWEFYRGNTSQQNICQVILNLFKCVNYLDAPIHKFHSKVPNKCEFILYILKINCYILLTFTLKNLNITFFMYNRNETEIN